MSARRPVQISEFKITIKEVSDDELLHLRKEITNTINKLNESILLMFKEKQLITKTYLQSNPAFQTDETILNEDDDATTEYKGDIKLYEESIQENKIVLRNNYERYNALGEEISNRNLELKDAGVEIYSLQELAQKVKLENENFSELKNKDYEIFEINESQINGAYIWICYALLQWVLTKTSDCPLSSFMTYVFIFYWIGFSMLTLFFMLLYLFISYPLCILLWLCELKSAN